MKETPVPVGKPQRTAMVTFNVWSLALVRSFKALTVRENDFLVNEFTQVKGLMPLLMKQRNSQRWTAEDKAELAQHLKRLSRLSPYLVLVALPGGFLMLPALAWWLDRRRRGRDGR
jgi:hypothetical protein